MDDFCLLHTVCYKPPWMGALRFEPEKTDLFFQGSAGCSRFRLLRWGTRRSRIRPHTTTTLLDIIESKHNFY